VVRSDGGVIHRAFGDFRRLRQAAAQYVVDAYRRTVRGERKLGGRLVTIIVEGDVSAVTEAVNAAATGAIKKPVSYAVIARPHEEIVRMVELSASRWKNNQGDE